MRLRPRWPMHHLCITSASPRIQGAHRSRGSDNDCLAEEALDCRLRQSRRARRSHPCVRSVTDPCVSSQHLAKADFEGSGGDSRPYDS